MQVNKLTALCIFVEDTGRSKSSAVWKEIKSTFRLGRGLCGGNVFYCTSMDTRGT